MTDYSRIVPDEMLLMRDPSRAEEIRDQKREDLEPLE